jgi:hypothetical protein
LIDGSARRKLHDNERDKKNCEQPRGDCKKNFDLRGAHRGSIRFGLAAGLAENFFLEIGYAGDELLAFHGADVGSMAFTYLCRAMI